MSMLFRPWLNRLRRALSRALLFRSVFGERSQDGQALPLTRISPSTCIEHAEGGFAHNKACDWWADRCYLPMPNTVAVMPFAYAGANAETHAVRPIRR